MPQSLSAVYEHMVFSAGHFGLTCKTFGEKVRPCPMVCAISIERTLTLGPSLPRPAMLAEPLIVRDALPASP